MRTKVAGWCIGILLAVAPMLRAEPMPQEDEARIAESRAAIVACHLNGGAIAAVGYRRPNDPVYIEPYFNNLACLGLLDADRYRRLATKPGTLTERDVVRQWLEFIADHQEPDGTLVRWEAERAADGSPGPLKRLIPDSHDSYAAGTLAVAAALARADAQAGGPKPSEKIIAACRNALKVLQACKGESGFYWTFRRDAVPKKNDAGETITNAQYTLDNLEVYQGLAAASELFAATGDQATADLAAKDAKDLASVIHRLWSPEYKFFVAMFGDRYYGEKGVNWGGQPYRAEGLATVSALAFLENVALPLRSTLWERFRTDREKQINASLASAQVSDEDPTLERIYFAALRSATPERQDAWLKVVRQRADSLLARNRQLYDPAPRGQTPAYVHRFGLIIQALIAADNSHNGREALPPGLPHVPNQPLPETADAEQKARPASAPNLSPDF